MSAARPYTTLTLPEFPLYLSSDSDKHTQKSHKQQNLLPYSPRHHKEASKIIIAKITTTKKKKRKRGNNYRVQLNYKKYIEISFTYFLVISSLFSFIAYKNLKKKYNNKNLKYLTLVVI